MKKKKVTSKDLDLIKIPKIEKRAKLDNERYKDFPLAHYSYSTFSKFCSNPFMFLMNYKQRVYLDSARNISGVMGNAGHAGLEAYQGGNDAYPVSNEEEGMVAALEVAEKYIEEMPEGFINFSTTIPTKAKAIEKVIFALNSYFNEVGWREDLEEVVGTEAGLKHYIDIEYKGKRIQLPIALKGFIDLVIRRVPEGKKKKRLSPLDYKFVRSFSKPDKIDGAKMIQAIEYFLLAYAEYGEEPYSMIYREIKHSKSRDGVQVQEYEFVYAEHKLMFDFYFRLYDDMTKAIHENKMVYVPNINDIFDADISIIAYTHRLDKEEEVAIMMEEEQVDTITELLKRKLEKKNAMGDVIKSIQDKFAEAKSINYSKMKNIEEKIKMKLLTLGVSTNFVEKIHGASVDRYLFRLGTGNKLREVRSKAEDVALVLGVDSVVIDAQKGMSETVYVDVPVTERKFFDSLPQADGYNLAMGVSIMGEVVRKDVRDFPHMLVAGSTGSGKSVFIEALLQQLKNVDETKLVLIDPKGTEMSHLKKDKSVEYYTSDIELAETRLKWEVIEMNMRFELLERHGVKDFEKLPKNVKKKLGREFIIFDEFGDFIAQDYKIKRTKTKNKTHIGTKGKETYSADITEYEVNISQEILKHIQLLSQKARAAGIHMIIATQRPSVDVITGAIKANFPAKAVFRVAKSIDSRVVMDEDGAEKLLGKGDFLLSTDSGVERLQGYFVD